jgi:hypothetical protein
VRMLIVTAPSAWPGQWGRRIATHLRTSAPRAHLAAPWEIIEAPEWTALSQPGSGPNTLSMMLDEPEDLLPDDLPPADLLLVLTESTVMTDLVPDLAAQCGAQAVIVPVDRRSWAPPGLIGQVRRRLEAMGISSAWPMPFCALTPSPGQHPLIQEFAQRYGRPELTCTVQNGEVASCQIVREAPCGNTCYIVHQLPGVRVEQAAEQCGLLHHYYPCWGGMETDPVHGTHTLLHIAATMAQKSVQRALRSAMLRSATPVGKLKAKKETDDDTKRA